MEDDYTFFSLRKEKEEWKEEWRKRRWQRRGWHKCLEKALPQIIHLWIKLIFSKCFRGECMCQLWKARKADDVGTLTKTILITFQFDVTSIHIVEEFGSILYWMAQPRRSFWFGWLQKGVHIESKGKCPSNSRYSDDVTKIQTKNLPILLSFCFHEVIQHLNT